MTNLSSLLGTGLTVSGGKINVTGGGGGSGVASYNGRTGAVLPLPADLTAALNGQTPAQNVTTLGLTGAFDANGAATAAQAASLQKANNLSDLGNAGTARTNLGLGAVAVLGVGQNVSTTGGVLAVPGVFRGAWTATTFFALNDMVTQGGNLVSANVAHTSAATYNPSNWTIIANIGSGSSALTVSNTYTASGAIAVTDKLAIVSGSSGTLAMTLASGPSDGTQIYIKRLGAATVTLTANIDGASRTLTLNSAYAPYECFSLDWIASLSTWVSLK